MDRSCTLTAQTGAGSVSGDGGSAGVEGSVGSGCGGASGVGASGLSGVGTGMEVIEEPYPVQRSACGVISTDRSLRSLLDHLVALETGDVEPAPARHPVLARVREAPDRRTRPAVAGPAERIDHAGE